MKQGQMSKAWVITSVSQVKTYRKFPVKKYYHQIKPLIYLQRALGELPYSFNNEGIASFKLLSFPVLYTVVYMVVHSAWTIYTFCFIVQEKLDKAPSYDVTLYWVSIALLLASNFTTPISKWIDDRKFINHISRWQEFQNNHLDLELKANLSLPIKIISVLILPVATLFIYCQSTLLTDLSLFFIVPFIIGFLEMVLLIIHWTATLYELRVASRMLLNKIITDGCRKMPAHRRTWLELSQLVSGVGESLGHTALTMSMMLFTSFVLSAYTLLSYIFQSGSSAIHFWGLLINTVVGLLGNFFLCNAAHLTTQEVGPEFSTKILALDLTHLSQIEISEITLLLQTISANPPTVEYLGFVTVNRSLFVSLISNAVTYLVVLIQFKSSPPVKPNNEEVIK